MPDGDVARDLAHQIGRDPRGELPVVMRDLRDHFGRSRLTDKARSEMAAALEDAGVVAEPGLTGLQAGDVVTLRLAQREAPRPERPEPAPRVVAHAPAPDRPAPAAPAGRSGEEDLGLGTAALVGVTLTVVGFIAFGFLGGLLMLLATGAVLWFVGRRTYSPGRALAVSAVALLAFMLIVVAPITVDEEGEQGAADPPAQQDPAGVAAAPDPRDEQYDRYVDFFEDRQYEKAVRGMRRLGDYRDARERAREFRRSGASALLDEAEVDVDLDPERAIRLARRAGRLQSSSRSRAVQGRARRAIEAERADAAPGAGGGGSASGDRDCDDFATQDEAQAALRPGDPDGLDADGDGTACESAGAGGGSPSPEPEPEPDPEPDAGSGGSGGCLPQSACPGRRDGDGDGCYCE